MPAPILTEEQKAGLEKFKKEKDELRARVIKKWEEKEKAAKEKKIKK